MTHGSLFSGIGGFDLAAQWMGWENKFHCEWNEFGKKVLKYYWPNATTYGDIDKTDFTIWRGLIDVLSGGFPCQPYSSAGKRKGKEDDRHKWPQMLRAIREIQPGWIVGENVRGLTNWNGGLVFDEVQADLEAEGYEVLPFLLPACAVNAPHRRDRIWFIAHAVSNGHCNGFRESGCEEKKIEGEQYGQKRDKILRQWNGGDATGVNVTRPAANTHSGRDQRLRDQPTIICEHRQGGSDNEKICINDAANTGSIGQQGSGRTKGQLNKETFGNGQASWSNYDGGWPTQSPICGRNDGVSTKLDGITFSKHAQESIKGYGNAVVPQVVYRIFKAIEHYNLTPPSLPGG